MRTKKEAEEYWTLLSDEDRAKCIRRMKRQNRFEQLRDNWIFPAIKYAFILFVAYYFLAGIRTEGPQWLNELIGGMFSGPGSN